MSEPSGLCSSPLRAARNAQPLSDREADATRYPHLSVASALLHCVIGIAPWQDCLALPPDDCPRIVAPSALRPLGWRLTGIGMFRRVIAFALVLVLANGQLRAQTLAPRHGVDGRQQASRTEEVLTDAAVALLIVAASMATYKATGRPCACPEDTMRNGRKCGSTSAWSKPGGYKPLCYPTEITAAMITAYRASKTIPNLR